MFWQEQCPARGPALTHVHSARCAGEHALDQCCECGARWPRPAATQLDMSEKDMRARLRSLGIVNVAEDPVDEQPVAPEHTDSDFVEPRAITGNGPTGSKWGWGRGEATPRFLERVASFVSFHAWLGSRGMVDREPLLPPEDET